MVVSPKDELRWGMGGGEGHGGGAGEGKSRRREAWRLRCWRVATCTGVH